MREDIVKKDILKQIISFQVHDYNALINLVRDNLGGDSQTIDSALESVIESFGIEVDTLYNKDKYRIFQSYISFSGYFRKYTSTLNALIEYYESLRNVNDTNNKELVDIIYEAIFVTAINEIMCNHTTLLQINDDYKIIEDNGYLIVEIVDNKYKRKMGQGMVADRYRSIINQLKIVKKK